jgi:hypothetical protein
MKQITKTQGGVQMKLIKSEMGWGDYIFSVIGNSEEENLVAIKRAFDIKTQIKDAGAGRKALIAKAWESARHNVKVEAI